METKSRTISQVHTAFSDNVACNRDRKHAQIANATEKCSPALNTMLIFTHSDWNKGQIQFSFERSNSIL